MRTAKENQAAQQQRADETAEATDGLFADQRSQTAVQRRIAAAADARPVRVYQRKDSADVPVNRTGMPNQLKAGIESLSGMDLSDVRVHRDSDKPAQLNALAYAQGNDIHLGPGQAQHLPHEAWHVVQQRQGRVQPTAQLKEDLWLNDEAGLEAEADAMGARAFQPLDTAPQTTHQLKAHEASTEVVPVLQRTISVGKESLEYPNAEVAFTSLRSTFPDMSETVLKSILTRLNGENAKYHDFRNLKYDIQQFAANQDLARSPDLWMKSGGLADLQDKMNGQVELWPDLSRDLATYCRDNPDEVAKSGDILDCGKLTVPVNLAIAAGDFTPGAAVVPEALRLRMGRFLINFMQANGQMAYIQSKAWFKDGSYKVVIEINFYPSRGFDEAGTTIGVHKDTDSRNLFVNLIFNNPTVMPGTEWTMDEAPPDPTRMEEWAKYLPPSEIQSMLSAKKRMEGLPGATPGRSNWEGGTVGANSYVSWVDEMVWHATPTAGKRQRYDAAWMPDWFANGPADYKQYFYEGMLIVAQNTHGNITDNLGWLKIRLKDQDTWLPIAVRLRTESGAGWRKVFTEVAAEIAAINWPTHKLTGGSGIVEVRARETDPGTTQRIVPTTSGGRPRSNSVDLGTIARNRDALLAMRGGDPSADLPKRSFIRTWVTLVKRT